jgi:pimeloyl-ACP methyl ester carboxylesterase
MVRKNIIIYDLNIVYYTSDTFNPDDAFIFLHGWQSSAKLFKDILTDCQNYIALELPGFNGSEISDTAWTINDYAIFLKNFLIKLGIKNPILIGHSFGGNIILKYLINCFPAQKAILIDSSGIRKKTFKQELYFILSRIIRFFYIIPGVKIVFQRYRKSLYSFIGSEDYISSGRLKKTYQNIINENLTTELKKINCPVCLIWGEDDKDTPIGYARILKENIKNSKLFIIKNAGHFVFLDQPIEFKKIFFEI